jgi:probable metal-binding protein
MTTDSQTESIHGHMILQMISETGEIRDKKELLEKIHTRYGAHPLFHNCMAEGLSAEQLIDFFIDKKKIFLSDSGVRAVCGNGCND